MHRLKALFPVVKNMILCTFHPIFHKTNLQRTLNSGLVCIENGRIGLQRAGVNPDVTVAILPLVVRDLKISCHC